MFLAAKKKDSVQQSTAENSGAVNVRSTGEPRQSIWLRALGGLPLQTKLTVNEPGDIYEEEADRVAAQVMRMPDPTAANARSCACGGIADGMGECAACRARRSGLQRKSDEGEECRHLKVYRL